MMELRFGPLRLFRGHPFVLLVGIVSGGVALAALLMDSEYFAYWLVLGLPESLFVGAVIVTSTAVGTTTAFLVSSLGLFGLRSESSQYEEIRSSLGSRRMETYLERILQKLETPSTGGAVFDETEKATIAQAIVSKTALDLGGSITKNLLERTAMDAAKSYQDKSLRRLAEHVEVLGGRANFALYSGLGFAALGVVFLVGTLVMESSGATSDMIVLASHYLPRLSIVIIVELVAFFFLRTFSRLLSDIRYMQNELTNIEMKLVGLHTALARNLKDVTQRALDALASTERNHVLEKGQTSLENERERIEAKAFSLGLNAAADLVRGPRVGPEPAGSKKKTADPSP